MISRSKMSQVEDHVDDFSRAYTKMRLFSEKVGLGKYLNGKVVLDVGSSTGGFTKFALDKGAKKLLQ